jgi:hypothetical protein
MLCVLALGFAGCEAGPGSLTGAAPAQTAPATEPMRPSDPVSLFAASAVPGQDGVVMENGVPVRARLVRSYQAASGRECREVVLGSGISERARIACRQTDGSFTEARPLLRGGTR